MKKLLIFFIVLFCFVGSANAGWRGFAPDPLKVGKIYVGDKSLGNYFDKFV